METALTVNIKIIKHCQHTELPSHRLLGSLKTQV